MSTSLVYPPVASLAAHDAPVNQIAFGNGGRWMATGDTAMTVKLWRDEVLEATRDTRSILDKVRSTERIRGLRFSPDARLLYVLAGEALTCFDQAPGWEPVWRYVAPRLFGFLIVSPTSLDVSRRGTLCATFDNGSIAVWDSTGGRRSLIRHNAVPRSIAFMPDETMIGTDGFSVTRWSEDRRRPLWQRKGVDRVHSMAVTEDGGMIALRSLFTTKVFGVESGNQLAEYRQGRGLPLIAFLPSSEVLALGTQHAITLHDVRHGQDAYLDLPDAELISLAALPDGSYVVGGCSDGSVRRWNNPFRSAASVQMP